MKMKYTTHCDYCGTDNITYQAQEACKCSKCGAAIPRNRILAVQEEEPVDQNIKKRFPIVIVIIFIVLIGLFPIIGMSCAILADMAIEFKTDYDDYQSRSDANWKKNPETSFLEDMVTQFVDALSENDIEQIYACMYLPEGSVSDLAVFERKFMESPKYQAYLGKSYSIQGVSRPEQCGKADDVYYGTTITLKDFDSKEEVLLKIFYMSDHGTWKIRMDDIYQYDFVFVEPDDCQIKIDGIEIPSSTITRTEIVDGVSCGYFHIPALTWGSHTATLDHEMGTYEISFDYTSNGEALFTKEQLELADGCEVWFGEFYMDLLQNTYDGSNEKAFAKYFDDSFSEEELREYSRVLKSELGEYDFQIEKLDAIECTSLHLCNEEQIEFTVGVGIYGPDRGYYREQEIYFETTMRAKKGENGFMITKLEDTNMFTH